MIGDGCGEKANAGLSDFGRSVVAEMNRVGVIPDCAHSGWQTSLESAKGGVEYWVAQIQPGRIMFEIEGIAEELAREAFQLAAAKLPFETIFVKRTVM